MSDPAKSEVKVAIKLGCFVVYCGMRLYIVVYLVICHRCCLFLILKPALQ